jgi:hypothetical protein
VDPVILFPPERFDANEWFIFIVSLIGYSLMWMLPKRFPPSMGLLISLVPLLFAKIFDTILSLPPFETYYVNDTNKMEWFDLFLYLMYLPFGYFFLYAYDWFRPKPVRTVAILTLTSMLAVLFEWITVKVGVFHYTGWQIYYSLPVYITVQSLYIILYEHMNREYIRTKR